MTPSQTMTTIRIDLPIATEPWERARSLFLEQLDPHERTLFEKADLNTIYHEVSVSHRQHQQSSKLQAARRRLAPLVDAIDGYGKGLDVMSNTPVAAALLCPIWGGIRVALYVAQETEKYFEKLAEMLEKIGRTLPLFRDYQHLFPNHDRLLQVLSEAYLNVLRFCTDVTAVFKEAKTRAVSLVSLTVSCKTLWKPFTLRFAEYLKNFMDLKQQVQDEANVAHMIESKRERERQERDRALVKARLREEKLRQTLQRFSPIDYHLIHRRLRSECHQGTTQWIFDHDSYKSWRETTESGSIHCNGIPGSGKTILASSIVENLIAEPMDPSHLTCFYYCDYADHRSLDPAIILGTFIRQILERSHQAEELREWVLNEWANRDSSPLAQELLPAVIAAFYCFKHVTVVIDALDELSPHNQHECGSIISTFLGLRGCQVKVFLSCRFEAIILNKVPLPGFSIPLSPKLLSKDIHRFVEEMVQDKIDSEDLTIQDPALQQEITDKLKEGAQDMFLWVKFQIAELCEAMNDVELRETLENLPKDLAGTYGRILHKISSSTRGEEKVTLAKRAFHWIVSAKRPLTIEELLEAVILDEYDKSFPASRIPTDGGTRLRLACGNLVVFDGEHKLVRFAHHTVRQFLTGELNHERLAYEDVVNAFRFTVDEAEAQTYALCLTYLCFSDFKSEIASIDRSTPKIVETGGFVPSLINFMLPHSGIIGQITALLKGQSHSTNNNKWSLSLQGTISHAHQRSEIKRKHHLLNYVSSCWCFHSPNVWDTMTAVPNGIPIGMAEYNYLVPRTRIVCEKRLPFSHRPWDKEVFGDGSQKPSLPEIPMFRWAARSGKSGLWSISNSVLWTQQDYSREESRIRQVYHDAMLYDNEQRDLLADILHGGSEGMLAFYFSSVRAHTIGTAIPARIICRVLRLSSQSRHDILFTGLIIAKFGIARGPPLEKRSFWRKESTSTLWLDNEWPATNISAFRNAGGTFLLEEAVKQDDIDLVRCILENDVRRVVYFGSYVEGLITSEESPLARAAYTNNTTMVGVLFSYINGTSPSVGAEIEDFDIDDLYEELEKRKLWLMRDHVRDLCRTGTGYPRIDTPNTSSGGSSIVSQAQQEVDSS